jgi:hypothetical protein
MPENTDTDRRDRYAAAIRDEVRLRLGTNALALAERGQPVQMNFSEAAAAAGAVMAVADAEQAELRAQAGNLRTMYDVVSARESDLIDERDKLACWHREDAAALAEMRATIERLRAERAELIRQRDRIAMDTMQAIAPPPVAPAVDRCTCRQSVHTLHHTPAVPVPGCPWCTEGDN